MPPGTSAVLTLVVRSDAGALGGLLIRNTADVTTTTRDPVPQNNQSSTHSQVFGAVDLEVRKTAQPTYVLPGEMVTYLITVTNHGPSAAQDVDVKEQLPHSTTLVKLEPSRGVCVSQICQFGAMTAGEQIVLTATVRADGGLLPGAVLSNTATGFTDTPDRNPGNNQDTTPVVVGPLVNIAVSKHAQVVTATVGTEITYTMIVTNHGPSLSPNVVLTDLVPAGFAYLRTSGPYGCTRSSRWYVVCPLGPLAAGATTRTDLVFFIESVRPGSVTNQVIANDPDAFDPGGGGLGEVTIPSDPRGPTAVHLARFDVSVQENVLMVTWESLRELDTWVYRLWRSTSTERDSAELITPVDIPARGSGSTYTYIDANALPKTRYYYWLQEIALSGIQKEIDVVQGGIDLEEARPSLFLPYVEAGAAQPPAPEEAPAAP
jgi:uncharacterized repeat protein (TIGR01451 family)